MMSAAEEDGRDWPVVLALTNFREDNCPAHGAVCPKEVVISDDPDFEYDDTKVIVVSNQKMKLLNELELKVSNRCHSYTNFRAISHAMNSNFVHCEWYFPRIRKSYSVDSFHGMVFVEIDKRYQSLNHDWDFFELMVTKKVHDAMVYRLEACIGAPFHASGLTFYHWYRAKASCREWTNALTCGMCGSRDTVWDPEMHGAKDMNPVTCARLASKALIWGGLMEECDTSCINTQEVYEAFKRWKPTDCDKQLPIHDHACVIPEELVEVSNSAADRVVGGAQPPQQSFWNSLFDPQMHNNARRGHSRILRAPEEVSFLPTSYSKVPG